MNHVNDNVCQACELKLKDGNAHLKVWFYRLKTQFPTIHISWCFRDKQSQDRSFRIGESLLKWPNSAHNRIKDGIPCSSAMDLFVLDLDGVVQYPPKIYVQIAEFLKERKSCLGWGGTNKTTSSIDHFQLSIDYE